MNGGSEILTPFPTNTCALCATYISRACGIGFCPQPEDKSRLVNTSHCTPWAVVPVVPGRVFDKIQAMLIKVAGPEVQDKELFQSLVVMWGKGICGFEHLCGYLRI